MNGDRQGLKKKKKKKGRPASKEDQISPLAWNGISKKDSQAVFQLAYFLQRSALIGPHLSDHIEIRADTAVRNHVTWPAAQTDAVCMLMTLKTHQLARK